MASTTRIDAALIEDLLYGSEGVDLDFKRDQYPFQGATDLDKAELLKDILAFANAFRRTDAYILIGVEEVSGGRANVIGVASHLNDSDLQQFVNTKTNRDVIFGYHAVEVKGKQVGVIRIQEQQRPIFLKRHFGFDSAKNRHRLIANVVYFRVGSSTKEASPDDIARMGSHATAQPVFDVDLQFADLSKNIETGTVLQTSHELVVFDGEIPNYTSQANTVGPYGMPIALSTYSRDNRDFWREAYDYLIHWKTLVPVGVCIHNRGDLTIDDVTVEIPFEVSDNFLLIPANKMPRKPIKQSDLLMPFLGNIKAHPPEIHLGNRGDYSVVTLSFGKLQTGERRFLSDALYLGNLSEKHVVIDATIRADQFPSPLTACLEFHTQGKRRDVNWRELKKIIEDAFFKGDEKE